MGRHLPRLLLLAAALIFPADGRASVATWQTCSIGPAGDTALCSSGGFPQDITSAAGSLWVTTARHEIIKVSAAPTTLGALTFYTIPLPAGWSPDKSLIAQGIVPGPDGGIWFVENEFPRIGRLDPGGGFTFSGLTPYPALKVAGARGLTVGPDGALWMTRYSGAVITRITTGGAATDFTLPGSDSHVALQQMISGPGAKLWFIRSGQRAIGSITTTGASTMFPMPAGIAYAAGLARGPDDAVWFTAVTNSTPRRGLVGRLAPDGTYRLFDLGSYIPRAIHTDGDRIWLGSEIVGGGGHGLLQMTTAGTVTRFEPLLFSPDISAITKGPDGAIWFTDLSGAQVGRVDGAAAPTTGAPTPVEIDPKSLALTATGVSVDVDASAAAALDVRAALAVPAASAGAGAIKIRYAKRVRVPRALTIGKRSLPAAAGKRRVTLKLPVSARRALRRGTRLRIAVRATESNRRKTTVQASLRAR